MYNSAWIDEYGKPLGPLDEEKLNGAKPLRIQDQIATDENGRRRFHGAFTGGFSAGYWNTVGSQEGWTPQNFKSSRAEKAAPLGQKPLDFMDDEDLEEFGSAPLSLQEREEDPTIITQDEINLKRVLNLNESKIMAAVEPEFQAKRAEREKRKAAEFNKRKLYVLEKYGCDTTSSKNVWHGVAEEEISAAFEPATTTVASETSLAFEDILATTEPKADNFGLGDYTPVSSDVTTSTPASNDKEKRLPNPLEVTVGSSQKKLSIRGHAFGVGALEEEDEDIYEKEDMSKYDFTLESRKKKKQRFIKMLVQEDNVVDDKQVQDSEPNAGQDLNLDLTEKLNKPEISRVLQKPEKEKQVFLKPRPWSARKSRFAPPSDNGKPPTQDLLQTADQLKDINPSRMEKKKHDLLASITAKSTSFVSAGVINSNDKILEKEKEEEKDEVTAIDVGNATKKIDFPASTSSFKPFPFNEAKQKRYEQFVESNACSEQEIGEFLYTIQPPEMSNWDREMEKKEFIQSRKLYRPLEGLMANRFVAGMNNEDLRTTAIMTTEEPLKTKIYKRKVAVERTTVTWRPSAQLCKRYNIAEPLSIRGKESKNEQVKHKKAPHLSIFDYIEGSVHTKADFVTPVIFPKHLTKSEEAVKPRLEVPDQTAEPETRTLEVHTARKSRWNIKDKEEQVQEEKEKINKEPSKETQDTAAKKIEASQNEAFQRLTFIPKAERHLDKPISAALENRGLFQAIFSDNDDADGEQQQQSTEITKTTQDALYPTRIHASSAASANLLRNTSPPRGIFAALFNETCNEVKEKPVFQEEEAPEPLKKKPRTCDESLAAIEVKSGCYGPALPRTFCTPSTPSEDVKERVTNDQNQDATGHRIKYKGLEIIEEWVEKSGQSDADSGSSCGSPRKRKHKSKKLKKTKKSKKSKKKAKEKDKEKRK